MNPRMHIADQSAEATAQPPRLVVPVNEKDHTLGPANAAVTLVEYGDYECPYCGNAYPIINQLRAHFGDQLRFVFRNFPLNTIHEHAGVAAQAAEAAGAQGKFWEMHDLLYEHQEDLAELDMVQLAMKLGLEVYRFEADLSGEIFSKRVRDDFRSGVRSGVNRTPTFFINDLRYDGELTYDALKAAIDRAMPS